jgi:hypothetical protein
MKMEAVHAFETLVNVYLITLHHIPDDSDRISNPRCVEFSFSKMIKSSSLFIQKQLKSGNLKTSGFSAALGLGVYSASNRNEYQKHKNNNVSGE